VRTIAKDAGCGSADRCSGVDYFAAKLHSTDPLRR